MGGAAQEGELGDKKELQGWENEPPSVKVSVLPHFTSDREFTV